LTQSLIAASEHNIETLAPKKIGGIDDLSEFKENRSLEYQQTLSALIEIDTVYVRLASDTLKYGVNGASLVELTDRSNNGLEASYNEMMEAYKIGYQDTEHLLALRQTMSAIFESWRNDSPFGHKAAEDFLKQRYPVSMNTLRLIPQLNRLLYLQQLTTTRAARRPDEAVYLQMNRLMTENLKTEILTYEDLRQYHDYTLEERHAALITIITKFKQVLNDSRLMQEQRPEFFRVEYHHRFNELLNEFITQAETELVQVVKEEQFLLPAAPARTNQRAKPQNQRVFRTEHQETFIGTLRPSEPGRTVDIIDVVDPRSGQPIASYSEHPGERGWVKIVQGQPTAPRPASPPKSWSTYKNEAQNLIDGVPKIEKTILFQKKKLDDPLWRDTVSPRDWNDMLEAQANLLFEKAQQAQAAHGNKPETAEWVARWRAAAEQMLQKARQHTADGYLVQTPTAENVDYLWRHGFVDINLVRRDIPTRSGDVFTEYVVRKKNKIDALWYAHFHYPKKGWARDDFRAAHLKTPQQRIKTQKMLIEEAGNNGVVEKLIRAAITKPLAEKLFLKL